MMTKLAKAQWIGLQLCHRPPPRFGREQPDAGEHDEERPVEGHVHRPAERQLDAVEGDHPEHRHEAEERPGQGRVVCGQSASLLAGCGTARRPQRAGFRGGLPNEWADPGRGLH